ncbi:ribonuclease P protein subunit p14 [Octodon degus]|uniref:Ribonuclease P protein subunit p14 n=1 Tax=Octodon degus TaxID=10160 RepID=A0A6P6EHE2_OCTDE|nr:ribonuclease P protein subunit p14 [Octodon degus]
MPASAATYERVVYKNSSEYHYMKVCLEFQDQGIGLSSAQFKQLLISALKDLFGEVGAALPLDVLTYEEKTSSAILRVCSRFLPFSLHYLVIVGI